MEIFEEKWFDLVNIFDINQAIKYTIWDKLYLVEDIEGVLNDHYLVEAFEEVDSNLEKLDNPSKFIYLIRIRDGIRILYEDFNPVSDPNDKSLDAEFEVFEHSKQWLKGNKIPEPIGLNREYFARLYNSIYLLHYNVEIELGELIARIPLQTNQNEEINIDTSTNKQLESKREFITNYFISGGKNIIANNIQNAIFNRDKNLSPAKEPYVTVCKICEHFKSLIENNGLFKLIYEHDKTSVKHENVPQKLFFAVSQIFCIANDIDVSPETNSGAGAVDFKFSFGYKQKITVEIKYSKNANLIEGYNLQLEAYNRAENSDQSIYLILNVDDNPILLELQMISQEKKSKNIKTPDLFIIDAKYKDSASKLKNNAS